MKVKFLIEKLEDADINVSQFVKDENDPDYIIYTFPSKKEVCSRCHGTGKHVNPNIDGNGITSGEWAEMCNDDSNFPKDYTSGKYDVSCQDCHGNNVVDVIDEEEINKNPLHKQMYDIYEEILIDNAALEAEERAYAKMERGY